MATYLTRMPAGIPGDPNRAFDFSIYTENITPLGTTGHPTAYGVPVLRDATTGNVRTLVAGDTTVGVGILVRPFPGHSSTDGLGVSTPPDSGPCDMLRRGCIAVLLSGATAAVKGAPVYIWTAAATGTHIVGGFESTDPTTSGFALTGAFFRGPADANGITEIELNL